MRDYLERDWICQRIDGLRSFWGSFPPDLLPPGFDLEPVFKYILDRVPVPEVSYRVDALVWRLSMKGDAYHPCLPEYNPNGNRAFFHAILQPRLGPSDNRILWLGGLSVAGPVGKKATWKVVYSVSDFGYVLDRFKLDRWRAHEILRAISRTPDDKILRYPTEEAAKEAVAEALWIGRPDH
jgi:hypothetical protein